MRIILGPNLTGFFFFGGGGCIQGNISGQSGWLHARSNDIALSIIDVILSIGLIKLLNMKLPKD